MHKLKDFKYCHQIFSVKGNPGILYPKIHLVKQLEKKRPLTLACSVLFYSICFILNFLYNNKKILLRVLR